MYVYAHTCACMHVFKIIILTFVYRAYTLA